MEEAYQRAVSGSGEERQEFLSGIDLGELSEYVGRLHYDGTGGANDGEVMRTSGGGFAKATINIFPAAFRPDCHPTTDDFLGTLFDHEGIHVRQVEKYRRDRTWLSYYGTICKENPGFTEIINNLMHLSDELEALENQVNGFPRKNFSETYINNVLSYLFSSLVEKFHHFSRSCTS